MNIILLVNIFAIFLLSDLGLIQIILGNHNYRHGGQGYQNHGQNHRRRNKIRSSSCPVPVFYDQNIQFFINGCENSNSPICTKPRNRIPNGIYGLIICNNNDPVENKKFMSLCSNGQWNPLFPSDCLELKDYSEDYTEYTEPEEPTQTQPIIVEKVTKKSCLPLTINASKNFEVSCDIPDPDGNIQNHIGPHCVSRNTHLPSGTITYLKCKPPLFSPEGKFSQWVCENGYWDGDFSNKLTCAFNQFDQSQVEMTTTTTSRPYTYRTQKPKTRKPFVKPQIIKIPTTTYPSVNHTILEPHKERENVSFLFEKEQKPIFPIQIASQKPKTKPVHVISKPIPISDEIHVESEEIFCPALFPRARGVKIECVSNKSQLIDVNLCQTPSPVGTEARLYCISYYQSSNANLAASTKICKKDGSWSGTDSFSCTFVCGMANSNRIPLITSGLPTRKADWPWAAAIYSLEKDPNYFEESWKFICGGTLIGKFSIVTAGHCVTQHESTTLRQLSHIKIDLGRYDLNEDIETNKYLQIFQIRQIMLHPNYTPFGYDSDIAIIILEKEVLLNYFVRPACFCHHSESAIEEMQLAQDAVGTVIGWGLDENSELAQNGLKMTRLSVIGPKECSIAVKSVSSGQIQSRSTTYCAKTTLNRSNVCNGDSGGGMFFPSTSYDGSVRWYLQGVVSVGIADESGKCDPNQVSVFTRVGRYAEWIVRSLLETEDSIS